MDTNIFGRLVRRYFSEGLSGKEEFELEMEASASAEAKAMLEQQERDDESMHLLREELVHVSVFEPWYQSKIAAMAASAALAVGATLLTTNTPLMVGGSSGVATSKVVYLETLRSASVAELPTVALGGENEWVTLIAYPAYDNFAEFRISVERMTGDDPRLANLSTASWAQVWQSQTDTGNQDALAINVRGDLLDEGVHRLYVEGLVASTNTYLPAANLPFRVTRQAAVQW